jgi:hypothetical protein
MENLDCLRTIKFIVQIGIIRDSKVGFVSEDWPTVKETKFQPQFGNSIDCLSQNIAKMELRIKVKD